MMQFDWISALNSFVRTYQQWPVIARAIIVSTIGFLVFWPFVGGLAKLALRALSTFLIAFLCVWVWLCRSSSNILIRLTGHFQGLYNLTMESLEHCYNAVKGFTGVIKKSQLYKKVGIGLFVSCIAIVSISYLLMMNVEQQSMEFASIGVRLFEALEDLILRHLPLV